MEYIQGNCLPLSFNADFDLWYPILDGDSSLIKEIGEPLTFNAILNILEIGDFLISDLENIKEIESKFPNSFVRRRTYWSHDARIEFFPTYTA